MILLRSFETTVYCSNGAYYSVCESRQRNPPFPQDTPSRGPQSSVGLAPYSCLESPQCPLEAWSTDIWGSDWAIGL